MMKNIKFKILIIPVIALLIISISFSFAFFTKTVNTNKEVSIKTGSKYIGVYGDNKNNISVGTTYTFTIENRGNEDASYYLYLDDKDKSSVDLSTITYSYTRNGSTTTKKLSEVTTDRQLDVGCLLKGGKITVTLSLSSSSVTTYIGKLRVKTVNYIIPTTPTTAGGGDNWVLSRTISISMGSTSPVGIKKYQYYLSTSKTSQTGGSWQDYNGNITYNTKMQVYFFARAVDNNGIYSYLSNYQSIWIGQSYSITNMVPNSSFESDDTSSWYNSTVARSTATAKFGSYSMTTTTNNSQAFARKNLSTYTGKTNHIIYNRMYTYKSTAGLYPIFYVIFANEFAYWHTAQSEIGCNISSSGKNTWEMTSGRSTVSYSNFSNIMIAQGATAAGYGVVYYDGLMVVDLTSTFGAGNEPDKTWCDNNIWYFDGSTSIIYK